MGDRRKCQTYTASPAEPGGLPVMLGNGSDQRDDSIKALRIDNGQCRLDFQELSPWPYATSGESHGCLHGISNATQNRY